MSEQLLPGLYLIATPIGHIEDISLRALRFLKEVDYLFCEDTRISSKLLGHYNIKRALSIYHDHSDEKVKETILSFIQKGKSVGLISDAGLPLISDPGFKLVRKIRQAGLLVTSIPGASACLTALQISGLPTDQFFFAGFLARRACDIRAQLENIQFLKAPLIFYITLHRLTKELQAIKTHLGDRKIVLLRELTKKFETFYEGTLSTLDKKITIFKGEAVLLIEGYVPPVLSSMDLQEEIKKLIPTHTGKDIVQKLHKEKNKSKKEIYAMLLEIKKNNG